MKRAIPLLQEYGVLVAFLLLFVINVFTRGEAFLSGENLRNLVSQNAFVGLIAVGMTFVIVAGGIDLAVGSLAALCGAVAIRVLNGQAPAPGTENMAILMAGAAAVLAGSAAGLLNGVVIAFARVAPFIVTLAGLAAYRSVALVMGGGGEIRSQVPKFQDFGFGGVPIPGLYTGTQPVVLFWNAILFLLAAVAGGFLLNRTRFGRAVIAVGSNERAAHYSAINTKAVKVWVYTLVGGLSGLAGFLLAARMNSMPTGSAGSFYELDAIAAVVIGGTSLRGGKGRIWGTVVGVLLLTLISNMMIAYRIDTNWQGLVRGLVILVAVLLQLGSKSED